MMRKIVALLLALSMLVSMGLLPVMAEETGETVEVTVQIYSNVHGTMSVDGLYRDNTFYILPDVICKLADGEYEVTEAGESVKFLFNSGMRVIHADSSGVGTEHMWDIQYEFELPALSHGGELYLSAAHLLRYLGCTVQFAKSEKADVHMAVFSPYTVLDLLADYYLNSDVDFSWAEVEGTKADSALNVILSGISALLFGYDSNLLTYANPFATDDLGQAVYEDAIFQVLSNEGYSHLEDEDIVCPILYDGMDVLSSQFDYIGFLTSAMNDMIDAAEKSNKLFNLRGVITDASSTLLSLSLNVGSDLMQSMGNTYAYLMMSNNQRVMLQDTLCQFTENDTAYDGNRWLFEAAYQIRDMIGNSQARSGYVQMEGIKSLFVNTGEAAAGMSSKALNNALIVYNAVVLLLKQIPAFRENVDEDVKLTLALLDSQIHSASVIQLKKHFNLFAKNLGYLGSSDTTVQRQIRSSILMALKASITARENLIACGDVTEESAARMEQKAKQAAAMLYKAEIAEEVPLGIPPIVNEDISWIRLLAKCDVLVTVEMEEASSLNYHKRIPVPTVIITGREETARRINDALEAGVVAQMRKWAADIREGIIVKPEYGDMEQYIEGRLIAAYASASTLSLGVHYKISIGGARETNTKVFAVFDLQTGEQLKITDLLNPDHPGSRTELEQLLKTEAGNMENNLRYPENLKETTIAREFLNNERNSAWYLSGEGLHLCLPEGYAGTMNGFVEGMISYESLEGVIADKHMPVERSGEGSCIVGTADGTEKARVYGTASGKALLVDGAAADVTVNGTKGILFYATGIRDALAWLPADQSYSVEYSGEA